MDETTTKFRSQWLPSLLFLALYSALGYFALMAPVGIVVTVLEPTAVWVWLPITGGVFMCAVLGAVLTPLVVWGYPTYVRPDGLKGYNFWGVYGTPAWDAVTAVRPLHLGVANFLRVFTTETSLPLWVPLFLDDMDLFTELVRDYAGPDHPLTAALDRYAGDEP